MTAAAQLSSSQPFHVSQKVFSLTCYICVPYYILLYAGSLAESVLSLSCYICCPRILVVWQKLFSLTLRAYSESQRDGGRRGARARAYETAYLPGNVPTQNRIRLHMCSLTAIYVPPYCYICVLILLYMCPNCYTSVLILIYVSSYCYKFVVILLYMCPHTAIYVSAYRCSLLPRASCQIRMCGWAACSVAKSTRTCRRCSSGEALLVVVAWVLVAL